MHGSSGQKSPRALCHSKSKPQKCQCAVYVYIQGSIDSRSASADTQATLPRSSLLLQHASSQNDMDLLTPFPANPVFLRRMSHTASFGRNFIPGNLESAQSAQSTHVRQLSSHLATMLSIQSCSDYGEEQDGVEASCSSMAEGDASILSTSLCLPVLEKHGIPSHDHEVHPPSIAMSLTPHVERLLQVGMAGSWSYDFSM